MLEDINRVNEQISSVLASYDYIFQNFEYVEGSNKYYWRVDRKLLEMDREGLINDLNSLVYIENVSTKSILDNLISELKKYDSKLLLVKEKEREFENLNDRERNPAGAVEELYRNIRVSFDELISDLMDIQSKLSHSKSKTIKRKRIPTSFAWMNLNRNTDGIKTLYHGLFNKGFVECSYSEFKLIFTESKEFTKIEWLGTKKELLYLFVLLIEKDLLSNNSKHFPHTKLKQCFKLENPSNLPQLLNDIRNDLKLPLSNLIFENLIKSIIREHST